jgi:hypothetical protein
MPRSRHSAIAVTVTDMNKCLLGSCDDVLIIIAKHLPWQDLCALALTSPLHYQWLSSKSTLFSLYNDLVKRTLFIPIALPIEIVQMTFGMVVRTFQYVDSVKSDRDCQALVKFKHAESYSMLTIMLSCCDNSAVSAPALRQRRYQVRKSLKEIVARNELAKPGGSSRSVVAVFQMLGGSSNKVCRLPFSDINLTALYTLVEMDWRFIKSLCPAYTVYAIADNEAECTFAADVASLCRMYSVSNMPETALIAASFIAVCSADASTVLVSGAGSDDAALDRLLSCIKAMRAGINNRFTVSAAKVFNRIYAAAPSMSLGVIAELCVVLEPCGDDDLLAMLALLETIERTGAGGGDEAVLLNPTSQSPAWGPSFWFPFATTTVEPVTTSLSLMRHYVEALGLGCVTVDILAKVARAFAAGITMSHILHCGSSLKHIVSQPCFQLTIGANDHDQRDVTAFLGSVSRISLELFHAGMHSLLDKLISSGNASCFASVVTEHVTTILNMVTMENHCHTECARRVRCNMLKGRER